MRVALTNNPPHMAGSVCTSKKAAYLGTIPVAFATDSFLVEDSPVLDSTGVQAICS
jgi:hypothetical protein